MLASKAALDSEECFVHLISFGSAHLKRVCRSTMQSETYQLQLTVESLDLVRAALVDARGLLDKKSWEESAASYIRAAWFTDCKSAHAALTKTTMSKTADKRLGIEVAALRQTLWRFPGRSFVQARTQDTIPKNPTDIIRWVDTARMIADPLTKEMKDPLLQHVLDTNIWSFKQTDEDKEVKTRKSAYRKALKKADVDLFCKTPRSEQEDAGFETDVDERASNYDQGYDTDNKEEVPLDDQGDITEVEGELCN